MAAAFFCVWLLEYRARQNNAGAAFLWVARNPFAYICTAGIMFFVILLFYGIFRKLFLSIGMVTAGILIIGYINIAKHSFRGVPVLPEDFALTDQAGTLTKFVDFGSIIRLIIAVFLTIILAIILDSLTKKFFQKEKVARKDRWWRRYLMMSRLAIVAVAVAGLLVTIKITKIWFRQDFVAWSQVVNYDKNGFLLGFVSNIDSEKYSQPDGYTEQKIKRIADRLVQKAKADTKRKALGSLDANILIVLNESFYDPEIIREYYDYTDTDVTPNLHNLQKTYPHGTMYSPEYGGGTANIEYAVLTGLTNYWLDPIPYTNFIVNKSSVPSVASFVNTNSLATATIHPFSGSMYKRDKVLPILGFDDFVTEEEFIHREKDGKSEYINDRSAYQETLDKLTESSEKMLISLITMQNHAPYSENEYSENKFEVGNVENTKEKSAIETYLTTVNNADKYLGEFIEKLNSFDEKTVVLFYGDHSAGVFPDLVSNEKKEAREITHKTPYFIYANFDLDSDTKDLPETTPNCLSNTLFNLLNVQKPTVFYLLDAVCEESPVLAKTYYEDGGPFASTAISEYELITYDLVVGNQWSLDILRK